MTTIKEDYVSFETAKLLKEKGFDQNCATYYLDGQVWRHYHGEVIPKNKQIYAAPTQAVAMKWLREEFDLITYVKLVNDGDLCHDAWGFSIYNKFTNESIKGHRLWFKYEEACEAAIRYCIENLI